MIRIAYCSQATRPDLALIALAEIIAVADRNNRRDHLTGALVVSRGRFFQVLEGQAVDVDRTLARIAQDPRHTGLKHVMRREVTGRLFPNWSMVAARVTPSVEADIERAIDACEANPDEAVEAVRALVERQQG